MTKDAGCVGFKEAGLGKEGDKTHLGEFTCLFQTVHGLIDTEHDVAFSAQTCTGRGKDGKGLQESRCQRQYILDVERGAG